MEVDIREHHLCGDDNICRLQASIQKVELDLRWDTKEFSAALDPCTQQVKALPATIEVRLLLGMIAPIQMTQS